MSGTKLRAALAVIFLAGSTAACTPAGPACTGAPCTGQRIVYFGGRIGGPGHGIVAARMDMRTGSLSPLGLMAEIERPTWLTVSQDRPVLYSVSEIGNMGNAQAAVYAFGVDRVTGALRQLSRVDSGGGGATYLSLAGGPALLVANYGSGQVSVLPIAGDGSLGPVVSEQSDYGHGQTPRQASPHAHGAVMDRSGHFVLVTDLGADRIFIYRYDAATRQLSPMHAPFIAAPPGSGPRHLALSPDGRFVYAIYEIASRVAAFGWDSGTGTLQLIRSFSTLPAGSTAEKSGGEILMSPDGRFVYVSNRGENTIVTYAVDRATGELIERQRIASGGKQPWGMTLDPDGRWLVVANESSDLVTVLARDGATGMLAATPYTLAVPHPSTVAFSPD